MSPELLPSAPPWVLFASTVIRHLPRGRYRATHVLSRYSSPEFLMAMPRELGGHLFRCNLRDVISREVCFTGYYEPQETAVVRSVLRPGMTFVDVGANWGYFTLLAASLVGRSGRVLCLEPDPRMFPILKENILRAKLDQVTPLQIAAAANAGFLLLAIYDERGENFGLSHIVASLDQGQQSYQVKAESLDTVLAQYQLDTVDLMKMDIEGAEALAITGLERSLATGRIRRLLLELHPAQLQEHGITAASLIAKLQQQGYTPWTIDHSLAGARRAAYQRFLDVKELLRPLNSPNLLDAWPHHLWLAPGVE